MGIGRYSEYLLFIYLSFVYSQSTHLPVWPHLGHFKALSPIFKYEAVRNGPTADIVPGISGISGISGKNFPIVRNNETVSLIILPMAEMASSDVLCTYPQLQHLIDTTHFNSFQEIIIA